MEIPLAIIATNLIAGTRHVFREGRVALAARASCSIPQIYHPVEIDGQFFVDGGIVEDLPLLTLATAFAPPVKLGVNLTANASMTRRPRHFLHLQWHLGVIVSRQNAMAMESLGDVVVRPNLQPYSSIHFRNIPEMVEEGYRATKLVIPEIHAAWNAWQTRARERALPHAPEAPYVQPPSA
jgi:NTE family protein